MKNSIAIWLDRGADEEDVKLDVHLNVWLSRHKNNRLKRFWRRIGIFIKKRWFYDEYIDNYIEFGFSIHEYYVGGQLHIYLPFKITHHDIKDIIPEFRNLDTLNALFNDKLNLSEADGGLYLVSYIDKDKQDKNFLASTSYFTHLNIEDIESGGSVLTIDVPKLNSDIAKILYKRIRIRKLENTITDFSINNSYLEGLFKRYQTVQIKINSLRGLPKYILDKMNGNHKINSINFFMMMDVFTNLIFYSKELQSSRVLEEDIWNEFLGVTKSFKEIKKIVAYQWKESKVQDEYDLFVKLENTKKKGLLIAGTFILIVILGIISGYLANKLTPKFDSCLVKVFDVNSTAKGD